MGYHFREQGSFVRTVEVTPALRKRIEATVEHLIALLDQYDGDENCEHGGDDEPWLGFNEHGDGSRYGHGQGSEGIGRLFVDDLELEDEHDEPTLGAPEQHPTTRARMSWQERSRDRSGDQTRWADGRRGHENDECEIENEHGGDIHDEPRGFGLDERAEAWLDGGWVYGIDF